MKKTAEISTQKDLMDFLQKKNKLAFEIFDYVSINKNSDPCSFFSNLLFWEDIEQIVKQASLLKREEKLEFIKNRVKIMNEHLPASVYIPFKRSYLYKRFIYLIYLINFFDLLIYLINLFI